jgi:hypothetical protein
MKLIALVLRTAADQHLASGNGEINFASRKDVSLDIDGAVWYACKALVGAGEMTYPARCLYGDTLNYIRSLGWGDVVIFCDSFAASTWAELYNQNWFFMKLAARAAQDK